MKNYPGFQSLVRAGAGLLLLCGALAAWGINITLNDGTNSVTCATSGNATIGANGDINATVSAGTGCDLSGGGDPPPPGSFTLSVAKAGTGSGTVTSNPTGINCGADCSEAYTDGTSVSLTATPASGSTFGGWSGACTGTGPCALSMTANRSVTATFNTDGGGGDCGALPPDVDVVNTGSMASSWPQQTFLPFPQDIVAFQFSVPSGFTQRGSFTATKTSAASRAKLVVISTCPGVLQPVGGQSSCVVQNLEASTVYMSGSASASSYYCKLTPGQTYYANAVSKVNISDTAYTCSNTTNCSFFASRSSPF